MRIYLPIFIFLFFHSHAVNATDIKVVDIDLLINKNEDFINLIKFIENDQIEHKKKFEKTEIKLQEDLKNIDNSRLILDQNEIENQIQNYNNDLNSFNDLIQKFNNHYEKQLNFLKNKILQTIVEILKNYATENKIDLILDTKSYIIATNSINITDDILIELNKIKFDIEFEKYK